MELKEYIAIFKKHFRLFWVIVVVFLLAGALLKIFQPATYKSSLTLNITRSGVQSTENYRYDGFYRLQADERFADTVVRWLESPRIVLDIFSDAKSRTSGIGPKKFSKAFKGKRFSSQTIQVEYVTDSVESAKSLSAAIKKILNRETEKLNALQKEENWFVILGDDPVVRNNQWGWMSVFSVSVLAGLFAAFWTVMIRHYIQ